jgi:glycosyltransferase involved in cell wall biosynthesis
MPDAQPAIIPWPLDEGDFRRRDDEGRQKARHELGIPESARVFLYFGRLHSMKRPLETISAFAEPARSGAHLIVAGNDSDVSAVECKAEAARFGVAGSVHVVGPAYGDSRRALFDAADVYVSLSHRENFNFTAAEALASAVPVILSPGNDLGADLAAEKCSWTLRALEEAREAFRAACEVDDATLLEMGARGRAWAVEQLRYVTFERRIKAFASEISRL